MLIISLHGNTLSLRNEYCFAIFLTLPVETPWSSSFLFHSRHGFTFAEKSGEVGWNLEGLVTPRCTEDKADGEPGMICVPSIAFCDTANMAGGDKTDRSSLWSLRCSECSGLRGPEESGEVGKTLSKSGTTGLCWISDLEKLAGFELWNIFSLSNKKRKLSISVLGRGKGRLWRKKEGIRAPRVRKYWLVSEDSNFLALNLY